MYHRHSHPACFRALSGILSLSMLPVAALFATVTAISLTGCQKTEAERTLVPVTLKEVAHSMFYAPQDAAI